MTEYLSPATIREILTTISNVVLKLKVTLRKTTVFLKSCKFIPEYIKILNAKYFSKESKQIDATLFVALEFCLSSRFH